MNRKVSMVMALALAGALAASGTALAAQGGERGKPAPTTTTTQPTQPRTCLTLGTAWHLGEYYEDPPGVGHYRVPMTGGGDYAFPACVDLLPQYAGERWWLIEWGGTLSKPMSSPHSGLRVVFEAEVHSGTYLDEVVTAGDPKSLVVEESVCVRVPEAPYPAPPEEAFVFVAMPWSGDKWISSSVTLTPDPDPALCSG